MTLWGKWRVTSSSNRGGSGESACLMVRDERRPSEYSYEGTASRCNDGAACSDSCETPYTAGTTSRRVFVGGDKPPGLYYEKGTSTRRASMRDTESPCDRVCCMKSSDSVSFHVRRLACLRYERDDDSLCLQYLICGFQVSISI